MDYEKNVNLILSARFFRVLMWNLNHSVVD